MLGVIPRGTGNVFKGRSHARITAINDVVIPGQFLGVIVIPGHYVVIFCCWRRRRSSTRCLLGVGVM